MRAIRQSRPLAKTIAALLLTICASTANAEWKFVVESSDGDTRWFLDTARIGYDDTNIWAWFLTDFKEPQTSDARTYYSMEVQEVINCVTREESYYGYIYYAEPMGRGKVINSDNFGGIGPTIAPAGSPAEKFVDAACDEFVRTYKPRAIKRAGL